MWKITLFVLSNLVLPQYCVGTQCLACNDIVEPTDCGIVLTCGLHQQCYVDNYVTANGHVRYNLGCRDTLQCDQADQADYPHSVVDKRSSGILICSECCQGPLCNNAGCGKQGYSALRGPVCYNCPDQLAVSDCETITVCGRDEVCLITQVANSVNHQKRYQTRCELNKVCYEEMNMIKGVLNQLNDNSCHIDCCATDLCNSRCNNSAVETTTVTLTAAPTNVVHHCQSNPCVSGTCTEHGDTYMCTCDVGVLGRNCEHLVTTTTTTTTTAPNPCVPNPCVHGTCHNVNVHHFRCHCDSHMYTGHLCNLPRTTTTATTTTTPKPDPCVPHPCVHGTCRHASNDLGYTCQCFNNYSGQLCDKSISTTSTTTTTTTTSPPDPCNSYLCGHGGRCIVDRHSHQAMCLCPPDRNGSHCEEYQHCGHRYNVDTFTNVQHNVTFHFAVEQRNLSHRAAFHFCQNHCLGRLVQIRTWATFISIHRFLLRANQSMHTDFWVDGTWNGQHNHWETSTGDRITENTRAWNETTNWGSNGNCVRFSKSSFVLESIPCDNHFGVICEYLL